ncbi:hypothetical protein CTAYLR_005357 [Chrysophaeum taylorii]|uniref:alpha-1,3-mannosyl-glycoprotein 2-beta-N-acetylglucosaminyltransferase n=1 Tax=Chrysophaeum taylorii TaxID=2483200 RepID=A0AAD7U8K2_9STRA|nr:hypothetical protein CTAYLR_005357 [Chrysophaeum taylorii]
MRRSRRRKGSGSVVLRLVAYCSVALLFGINVGLQRRTPGRPEVVVVVEELPEGRRRSLREAVVTLRGRVDSIKDRATADAAWSKISEASEWLRTEANVPPPSPTTAASPERTIRRRPPVMDASTVILVICHERAEMLRRCLGAIVRYHPCGGAPVLVSQDGLARNNDAVEREVRDAGARLEARCGNPLVVFARHGAQSREGTGYHKLARHFKFALGKAFEGPGVRRVLVLEEDLEVARDAFDYFAAVAPILDADKTLLAASAWNDNGQAGKVKAPDKVVRSDFFPGLGWMLTSDVWRELEPKWPEGYWDDWLREPAQRKGRHVLRPEICRTFHLATRGTSNNQYGAFLKKIQLYEGDPVDFVARRDELAKTLDLEAYDTRFGNDLRNARLLASPDDLASLSGPGAVRIEYVTVEDRPGASFPALARRLGIMDNVKAGVPRAAYRGVVQFWHGFRVDHQKIITSRTMAALDDGPAPDYETQGMALKLKELDEELKKYETQTYPCEAHLTWCCGGSHDLEDEPERAAKYPFTISAEAQRLGATHFDKAGVCTKAATHRVVILDREEKMSVGLARPMQPTLCLQCVQIAVIERIFREIIQAEKADQLEQDFAKQMEAEEKKNQKKSK